MRILGLDYGTRTCGVAISDPLGLTAQGLETITRPEENKLRRTYARIEEICSRYGVEKIVLGLPYNMDDTLGPRGEQCLAFKEGLVRRTHLPVILQDERLTTAQAEETLNEAGVRGRKERKNVIDKLAAMVILQEYLDALPASETESST